VERRCATVEELVEAIRELAVRGAPSLGVAAAMGMALAAERASDEGFEAELDRSRALLAGSRPTAVNLVWGLEQTDAARAPGGTPAEVRERLAALAARIQEDEVERGRRMGAHGAALLARGARVLTHCNAGPLACGGHGSALAVIRHAAEDDPSLHVWVAETRPLLQGARLTAWELGQLGVDHTLVVDSAAGQLFARGLVDAVVVGADRICANGDVANKVGTYTLSVLARAHGVPLIVVAPSSTVDTGLPSGSQIPIEERDPQEVLAVAGVPVAPAGTRAANPAFDVTPAANVSAIVTEEGVHRPPYAFRPAAALAS
jgi:methylthioribose-1-phosphate isomerase